MSINYEHAGVAGEASPHDRTVLEINRCMISYEIRAATVTSASPERILSVLDDFSRWPTWMPALERVRVELPEHQAPGPGYRFRLRGRIIYADLEVIDFSRLARATRFTISFPPFSGVNRCLIRPLSHQRSKIERIDTLQLPKAVVQLVDSTQRARFERLAAEFLKALKSAVEQYPYEQPPIRNAS